MKCDKTWQHWRSLMFFFLLTKNVSPLLAEDLTDTSNKILKPKTVTKVLYAEF